MKYDVVIIGAGPGGLRCGKILADHGVSVLILEKNPGIGKKVCAGGITWNGLIDRVPESLIERSFFNQTINTSLQQVEIKSNHPIIATVNRVNLGVYMSERARGCGAEIRTGARLVSVSNEYVTYTHKNKSYQVFYDYIVGADGSFSKIRSHIGLATQKYGIGINYTLPCISSKMIWHFDARSFGSGYAWIFPHQKISSVGVYAGSNRIRPKELRKQLDGWIKKHSINIEQHQPQAERINIDYQGWNFGRTFLVGDAAGLASPLTGEGIYPAFVSAEAVAKTIINQSLKDDPIHSLISKHKKHALIHKFADKNMVLASLLSEISAFLLRFDLISFEKFEMV